jgi:hypothetical protein
MGERGWLSVGNNPNRGPLQMTASEVTQAIGRYARRHWYSTTQVRHNDCLFLKAIEEWRLWQRR